jgi:co-chaperonin GroES (HSP10)
MPAVGKAEVERLKALNLGLRVARVLGRRLLVKVVEPSTDLDRVEASGLLTVPKWVKEQNTPMPNYGVVVEVGAGVLGDDVLILAPGTMVLFSKFSGVDLSVQEERFRILGVDEVLCTLETTEGWVLPLKES